MVSFRKVSMAFAGVVLMGASAAYGQLACTASLVSTNVRQEALTQPIEDFEISCTVPDPSAAVLGNTATIQLTSDGFQFTGLKDENDNLVNASIKVAGAAAVAGTGSLSSNGQAVTWSEVSMDALNAVVNAGDGDQTRKIVISGLKMNASGLASLATPKVRVTVVNYGDLTRAVKVSSDTATQEIGSVQSAISFEFKNKHSVDCNGIAALKATEVDDIAERALLAYISFNEAYPGSLAITDKVTARFKVPAGAKLYVASSSMDAAGNWLAGAAAASVTYGVVAANTFVEVKADENGVYEATWTISGVTASKDKYRIPLYISVPANSTVADNLTATGSLGPFSSVVTATDDTDVPEPRFITPTDYTDPIYEISSCKATLLFPYATNVGNWDTGIAISNITADMKNADGDWASGKDDPKAGQKGACTLYFVGENAPEKAIKTDVIDAGKTVAFMVGSKAEGFNGYLKVQCDFNNAKGLAFMSSSDLGGVGVGYLAIEGLPLVP